MDRPGPPRGGPPGAVETRYAGVIPTAGVAALVRELGAAAGVVVSASHNPYPDNGIKLLDADGFKWSRDEETALERRLLEAGDRRACAGRRPARASLGAPETGLVERYLAHLAASLPGERPLAGLRVALDTGNGAASAYAGGLFERLGAEARVLHDAPDGTNVNRGCGSTDPRDLLETVRAGGFHLGAAFDGDADRVILVDAGGETRDGDAILYLWASALDEAGALSPRSIVATSMSNLGLERALAARGIGMVRCGVGDREVVETMRREGILPRRRAVRPHRAPGPHHHRRRPAHRPPGGRHGRPGAARARRRAPPERAPGRLPPLSPGAAQRAGRRQAGPGRRAGGRPRRAAGRGAARRPRTPGAALQRHRAARPGDDRGQRPVGDRGAGRRHRRRDRARARRAPRRRGRSGRRARQEVPA